MADCPNRDKTCDICGKTGHLKIKCRMEARQTEKSAPRDRRGEGKDSRGRSDASKTCNNCGEVGHLARTRTLTLALTLTLTLALTLTLTLTLILSLTLS